MICFRDFASSSSSVTVSLSLRVFEQAHHGPQNYDSLAEKCQEGYYEDSDEDSVEGLGSSEESDEDSLAEKCRAEVSCGV